MNSKQPLVYIWLPCPLPWTVGHRAPSERPAPRAEVNVHRRERKKWVCDLEGVKQSVQIVSPNWTLEFLIFTFYDFAAIWYRQLSSQVFSAVKVDRNFKSAALCKNQNKDQKYSQFFELSLLNHGGSVSRDTRKGPISSDLLLSLSRLNVNTVWILWTFISLWLKDTPLPPLPVAQSQAHRLSFFYDGCPVMAVMSNSFIKAALYRHDVITAAASDFNFGLYPAIP